MNLILKPRVENSKKHTVLEVKELRFKSRLPPTNHISKTVMLGTISLRIKRMYKAPNTVPDTLEMFSNNEHPDLCPRSKASVSQCLQQDDQPVRCTGGGQEICKVPAETGLNVLTRLRCVPVKCLPVACQYASG